MEFCAYPGQIVNNHGPVCRQPCAYHEKPESKCYAVDRFIGTIAQRSDYYPLLDAVRGLRIVMNSTEDLC